MKTVSRRAALGVLTALGGIAAADAAVASPADEAKALAALMRQTDRLTTDLSRLLNLADDMHPDYDPARVVEVSALDDLVWEAQCALADFPVTRPDTIAAKMQYFRLSKQRGDMTTDDAWRVLWSIQPAGVL